jgi:nucleoid-associated protein YgaU
MELTESLLLAWVWKRFFSTAQRRAAFSTNALLFCPRNFEGKIFPISLSLHVQYGLLGVPPAHGLPMLLAHLNGDCLVAPRLSHGCARTFIARISRLTILFLCCSALPVSARLAQEQQSSQNQETQQAQRNQSVADAARRERARKESQQKAGKHVYTEEDLKRARILTPEDQAKVEARKNECSHKNNCAPSQPQNAPAALDADSQAAQPSLGEIARQLREQKELEALRPKQSEPFHLSIGNPSLAAPIAPEHRELRSPAPPVLHPEIRLPGVRSAENSAASNSSRGSAISRRDPFAPVPQRPRVPFDGASQLRPAKIPSPRVNSVAPPKLPHTPNAPQNLLNAPAQPATAAIGDPIESRSQKTTQANHAAGREIPAPHAFRFEPVRPFAPSQPRLPMLAAPPANLFHLANPAGEPPLANSKPTAPLAFSSSNPGAAVRPVVPSPAASSSSSPSDLSATRKPEAPLTSTVLVQPGDSLWKLARKNLGRGSLWPRILATNPGLADPNRLVPGVALHVPAALLATQAQPSANGPDKRNKILVQKGDTLWSLAKAHLGSAATWPCLASANPSVINPQRIFAGQELEIPQTCHKASSPAAPPQLQ